jgi:thiamine-phosphate pyrophosphorylase
MQAKFMQSKIAGLYAITPDLEDTARLCQMVEASILGGASVVQYRNKVANEALRFAQASALLPICRQHQIPFIINDHLDLFLALDADGLHIGGDDGDIRATKQHIGQNKLLGVSCYTDFANAEKAEKAGADYVAFGACFPSNTKPHAPRTELNLFTQAKALSVPAVAIGGITLENAGSVIKAGASAIAVIGELFNRNLEETKTVAQQFSSLFLSQ